MSNSIFDLPFTFVIFNPGAGGNFVSKLLSTLHSNALIELSFSTNGNSHVQVADIPDFIADPKLDFLWRKNDQRIPTFDSLSEKVTYFKDRVSEYYSGKNPCTVNPWVMPGHMFKHIPMYKTVFPNCKLLVITQYTTTEYWAGQFNFQVKDVLEPSTRGPRPADYYTLRPHKLVNAQIWNESAVETLMSMMPVPNLKLATTIVEDKYNPMYLDILCYTSLKPQYDAILGKTHSTAHHSLITEFDSASDYVELPYSYIMQNDSVNFLNIIEQIYGSKLSDAQSQFVISNFAKYHAANNQLIMSDPIAFFQQLKINAYSKLNALCG